MVPNFQSSEISDPLKAILDELKNSPFRKGDLQERDLHGRDNEITITGNWLVTFWVDHAAREIRVVRLESAED